MNTTVMGKLAGAVRLAAAVGVVVSLALARGALE